MSDTEDILLPVPSRNVARGNGTVGGGGFLSGFGNGRSSKNIVDGFVSAAGLRTAGSRRVNNYNSSFASNGSKGGLAGGTEGSAVGRGAGDGGKACSACGIQFTWRMRRHHCRGCKQPVCDPCSKERLALIGDDSKRHRVCHPCLKEHLHSGRTREHRIIPKCDLSSLRSSPFESRNASRDTSYHGPGGGRSISKSGLATYKEDAEGWVPEINHVNDGGRGDGEDDGASSMSASTSGRSLTSNAADTAAAAAAAMVAAWTGSNSAEVKERKSASAAMAGAKVVSSEAEALPTTAAATVVNTGATAEVAASSDNSVADPTPTPPTAAPTEDGNREEVPPPSPKLVLSIPSEDGGWGEIGGEARRAPAVSDGGLDPTAEGTFVAPAEESGVGKKRDRRRGRSGSKDEAAAVAATATMAVVDGIGAGSGGATQKRPSLGEGVVADPTSHQHKRPVQSAKDSNPLALPWFTGKHVSPCTKCEDLWKVAWGAREDFLRDLTKAQNGKDYQLVASSGDNLRLYAAGNMFWGGQAIRLRVEMEVAVPIGFAMRWLASLTARGGVYYPYSDTSSCDIVEANTGALSVACAHWPTQLSGVRRCTLMRYVSENGSSPPGMEEEVAAAGSLRDPRPTIVFATIDHPIMREWALPGVDVEVFPSGLVLEEMDSPAGPVTKVHGLIGWDNKGAVQHMAKMTYMTERGERLEGLGQHLRAMERGYQEQSESEGGPLDQGAPKGTAGPTPRHSVGSSASKSKRKNSGRDGGLLPAAGDFPVRPKHQLERGELSSPSLDSDGLDDDFDDDYDKEEEVNESDFEMDRRRMTSRVGPMSPDRGRDLSGGYHRTESLLGTPDLFRHDGSFIRRKSESGPGGLVAGIGGSGRRVPSPTRAAELEAEVSFLNRQLFVRQTLEERLRVSEEDKARLITKLATAKAEASRSTETLEQVVESLKEKLTLTEQKMLEAQRKLLEAEGHAASSQRDLRLAREALRVQANLSTAATSAADATSALSFSPGSTSRFPASNYDLPLASSPALRAPPPSVGWGSGSNAAPPAITAAAGGGGGAESGVVKGKNGGKGSGKGGMGKSVGGLEKKGGGGGRDMLLGRTQEMGVRFALDTLRYSEDEEVVVFMLHLVQGLRHEAEGASARRGGGKNKQVAFKNSQITAAPSSGPGGSQSTVARALFNTTDSPPGKVSTGRGGDSSGGRGGVGGPGSGKVSQLASLLIARACDNDEVANFLFWYLKLEAETDAGLRPMYLQVRAALMEALLSKKPSFASSLKAAESYVSAISEVHATVKRKGGRAPKKTARLKAILTEKCLHIVPDMTVSSGSKGEKRPPQAIPLPLDPRAVVVGLRPATAYSFPSAMSPCVVEFVLSDSVGPSFKGDELLLEPPEEDGPRMVTDISLEGLKSWSGGPLPRQHRLSSGGTTIVHAHAHVEAWEAEDATERSWDATALPPSSSQPPPPPAGEINRRRISTVELDTDEDFEDESFLDRRKFNVGSTAGETDAEEALALARAARVSMESLSGASRPTPVMSVKFESSSNRGTHGKNEEQTERKMRPRSTLVRQASSDLSKLRLWEQMQVLGAASQERGSYLAIFKNGEDVRQDQLAVHMVSLMDRQLKEAGLDLKLRSYRVLATGLTTGMIEFVPGSIPMSAVLATHNNSLLEFLRHHNADPNGPLGMKREALDIFTRSCAGSCVVTYLLGVGDRHLDNLMLLPEGVLFHIDFGYMFGKDPKVMPTPFRLTKEMVEAMGGTEAPHYTVFKSLCCQAYRHLRKSAHQYLNLLSLMSGAGIKDLSDDPAAVLQLVQDRFKMDLTDEQADAHFLGLVSQSVTAIAPRVLEVMHQIRVAAR